MEKSLKKKIIIKNICIKRMIKRLKIMILITINSNNNNDKSKK